MDPHIIEELTKAGLDTTLRSRVPKSAMEAVDESSPPTLKPMTGDLVAVIVGEEVAMVHPKPISQLFAGSRVPPSFKGAPPEEYAVFFAVIERTAIDYCQIAGPEYDVEFKRLYNQLRRRPDGTDANPLFGYLQGAVRLYMSLRDVSQAEFDAVLRRLTQSASHFEQGAASTNYIEIVTDQWFPSDDR